MRIINFCAEGIEQAAERGFFDWALEQDADFICVQDLRKGEYDIKGNACFPSAFNAYFFDAVQRDYKGVAVYTRELPKAIMTGLGFADWDTEGMYVQADFERVSIASFLAPYAAPDDEEAQERKMDFYEHFLAHLSKVRNKRREFIICGNWNIAHKAADEQEPADNTGFIAQEKQMITQLYQELGYGDAFRLSCSDDDEYTWWPDENRDKGGRRIDTQVVSEGLIGSVEYAFIYKNQAFSNHAPVVVDYEYDLF